MKITADLKCMSCGRIWATTQDDSKIAFGDSALRSNHPQQVPLIDGKNRRCPRCYGTLWLEMIEPEEYETDLLIGA